LSALDALRAARTRYDVAALLGYKPSALSFIVYRIPVTAKHTTFEIKKKGGGVRRIDAPIPKVKGLQKKLADVLYECQREIEASEKRKNKTSHAFREDCSIITNAKAHRSRRYVLNLDLQNFFPSLHFGRIRGFFLNNNYLKLAEPVATVLAQIACNDGVLPQGSPCSPILSELLTHFLDIRLAKLCSGLELRPSRRNAPKSRALRARTRWRSGWLKLWPLFVRRQGVKRPRPRPKARETHSYAEEDP